MKALVIGGGGREHALAWSLARSPSVTEVFITPGNPGAAAVAKQITPPSKDAAGYLAVAQHLKVDLTVVGPEAPLVEGVVDLFQSHGLTIFGPTANASQLEGSKIFSKSFMQRAGIPTARHVPVTSFGEAISALAKFDYPVVLKADGLAAGKGVVIANDENEAVSAIENLMSGQLVGPAGRRLVIEECLRGEEVSFIAISDGRDVAPLEPSQDHKNIFDGDRGPNTGGMGAYSDSRILTATQSGAVMGQIVAPVIEHMRAERNEFRGFLYVGLMMTKEGPKVLEFNVRMGDPEAQPLLHRLDCDLGAALWSAARGDVTEVKLAWKSDPSVCVVLAASGYPAAPRKGDVISGIEEAEASGAVVFHAGTKMGERGLEANGGRVLGVTASGPDLATAIARAYDGVKQIHFDGMQYRTDIGQKGLKRYN